eukprot:scaffold31308_cov49-Attheya_sp.AAC.2
MSNPASPSSSPSKETPNENEDGLWEEAFANMDEQENLFQELPTTEADAMKVFETFNDKSHIGPIVLAKGISPDVFSDWLDHSELGLDKSERLVNCEWHCLHPTSMCTRPWHSAWSALPRTALSHLERR